MSKSIPYEYHPEKTQLMKMSHFIGSGYGMQIEETKKGIKATYGDKTLYINLTKGGKPGESSKTTLPQETKYKNISNMNLDERHVRSYEQLKGIMIDYFSKATPPGSKKSASKSSYKKQKYTPKQKYDYYTKKAASERDPNKRKFFEKKAKSFYYVDNRSQKPDDSFYPKANKPLKLKTKKQIATEERFSGNRTWGNKPMFQPKRITKKNTPGGHRVRKTKTGNRTIRLGTKLFYN